MVIGGIILAVMSSSFRGLIVSAFGIMGILWGWLLWKRTNSLVKGEFK